MAAVRICLSEPRETLVVLYLLSLAVHLLKEFVLYFSTSTPLYLRRKYCNLYSTNFDTSFTLQVNGFAQQKYEEFCHKLNYIASFTAETIS